MSELAKAVLYIGAGVVLSPVVQLAGVFVGGWLFDRHMRPDEWLGGGD